MEDLIKTLIMKKFIGVILLIGFISCNSSNNENTSSTDSTTTEIGGVQNVNGNIPDTSMGATPNSPDNQPHVDSTYADTVGKTQPQKPKG
jgi:hypothetical protein